MIKVLLVDEVDLFLRTFASASGALLVLAHLVDHVAAELILLNHARHKPISVEAEEVEAVEALVYPH